MSTANSGSVLPLMQINLGPGDTWVIIQVKPEGLHIAASPNLNEMGAAEILMSGLAGALAKLKEKITGRIIDGNGRKNLIPIGG